MVNLIRYAEFYITNHCNLNCEGCNRFNNYNFVNSYKFDDYAAEYERWSQLVNIRQINILGGEPLMNPDLPNWARNIRRLWPDARLAITSNGTLFTKHKTIYNTLKDNNIVAQVSIHDYEQTEAIKESIVQFLQAPVTRRMVNENDKIFFIEEFVDINGVNVSAAKFNTFHQSTLMVAPDTFKVYDSDPALAHKICDMKGCHTFLNGRLYKCGVAAVLPEFIKQFKVELDESKLDPGLSVDDVAADPSRLNPYLTNHMSMCSMCPDHYEYNVIAEPAVKKTQVDIKLRIIK